MTYEESNKQEQDEFTDTWDKIARDEKRAVMNYALEYDYTYEQARELGAQNGVSIAREEYEEYCHE